MTTTTQGWAVSFGGTLVPFTSRAQFGTSVLDKFRDSIGMTPPNNITTESSRHRVAMHALLKSDGRQAQMFSAVEQVRAACATTQK